MRALLRHIAEKVRSTMWLLPASLGLAGAGLAFALLHAVPPGPYPGVRFAAGPSAAHALLATIAGAMIGVAGVTFSITVVTLAMASQQMGPRLLRGFIRDRVTQAVFGCFVATFLYALLVLQAIPADAPDTELPHVAITGAVGLATVSLGMLLYFIHHTAQSIQSDSVVAVVAGELHVTIRRLEPAAAEPAPPPPEVPHPPKDAFTARTKRAGYLQAVQEARLLRLAQRHALVISVLPLTGEFVAEGGPLLQAWPRENVPARLGRKASRLAIVGDRRTAEQDIGFSIDQLAELAVRALSPGINDPYTALRCVDRLGAALAELAQRQIPSSVQKDEEGHVRLVVPRPSFADLMDAGLDPVRQAAGDHPAVTVRMLEVLERIALQSSGRKDVLDCVRAHIARIGAQARQGSLLHDDLKKVLERKGDAEGRMRDSSRRPGPRRRIPH